MGLHLKLHRVKTSHLQGFMPFVERENNFSFLQVNYARRDD
jgi:hypothetical protein